MGETFPVAVVALVKAVANGGQLSMEDIQCDNPRRFMNTVKPLLERQWGIFFDGDPNFYLLDSTVCKVEGLAKPATPRKDESWKEKLIAKGGMPSTFDFMPEGAFGAFYRDQLVDNWAHLNREEYDGYLLLVRCILDFQAFGIGHRLERIMRMPQQLTFQNYCNLLKSWDHGQIRDTVIKIDNHRNSYRNLYSTLLNWMEKLPKKADRKEGGVAMPKRVTQ